MVICRDCKHLVQGDKKKPALCGKVKRTAALHPVTGEKGFTGDTKFGKASLNQDPYERCIAVNPAGECKLFEKKP